MVNWKSRKFGDLLIFLNGVAAVVLINMLVTSFFFRIDLTEEKRYSIKPQTRALLENLDDDVYAEIFLEGDLNAEFKRFQKAIQETLEEFRIYSKNKVHYTLTDPSVAKGEKAQSEYMAELASKGIQPTNVIDKKNGQRVEKILFPGVVISYGGEEKGVMLLKGNKAASSADEINQSIEGIEFELVRAISNLVKSERNLIGLVHGHGELDSIDVASFTDDMLEEYDLSPTSLTAELTPFSALIIAKPTRPFSSHDKFALDQYIMRGGKVLFLIDKLDASMDSASRDDYFALPYNTELDDQLFKYGVRINPDLIQDHTAGFYPVVTGDRGGKPQINMLDFPFFPLINHYADHPITRNLDAVITRFVSSIDTVKAEGVRKTALMMTSQQSRTLTAPVKVSANDLRRQPDAASFEKALIPIGFLLEGSFTSLYKNRFLPEGELKEKFVEKSLPTRIIVIADGDIIRNEVNFRTRQPRPLGFDLATNYTFANRELLMNALSHLTQNNGLIQARNKQVMIRPLNKSLIQEGRTKWQVINLVIPLVILLGYGLFRVYWRKRKFASF